MTFFRLKQIDTTDYVREAFSGAIPQPGVVEWVNNEPGGGAQAPVSIATISPPYPGTHFVAGQEDATDANANRAHEALAHGLDDIDDLMHRGLSIPAYIEWTPVVGANPTFTITPPNGPVYLGIPSLPDHPEHISLVRASDHAAITDVVGNRIAAVSIDPPVGDGTLQHGFSPVGTSVVIHWNAPVQGDGSTVYRVYYGKKKSLGTLARGDLSRVQIFNTEAINAAIQQLFLLLHADPSFGQTWDGPWTSTIHDLAYSGLHDRYLRATSPSMDDPGTLLTLQATDWGTPDADFDTPGAGNWIYRTGPAPTSISRRNASSGTRWFDKFDALWRAVLADVQGLGGADEGGGSSGFVTTGAKPLFHTGAPAQRAPGLASFLHTALNGMSMQNSSFTPNPQHIYTFTCIGDQTPGTVSFVNLEGQFELQIELAMGLLAGPGSWFWKVEGSFKRSAINCGADMLELKDATGKTYVCLIYRMHSSNRRIAYLRTLAGRPIVSGTIPEDVTCRWHSVCSYASDGVSEREWKRNWDAGDIANGVFPAAQLYGAGYFQPALIADNPLAQMETPFPFGVWGNKDTAIPSLWWGHRGKYLNIKDQTTVVPNGFLMPNGNVWSPGIFVDTIGKYDFMNPSPIQINYDVHLPYTLFVDEVFATSLYSNVTQFNRVVKWNRIPKSVTFNVQNRTVTIDADEPYVEITCGDGGESGDWHLEISIVALIDIGSQIYISVKAARGAGSRTFIRFTTPAGIGRTLPGTSFELLGNPTSGWHGETMLFRLFSNQLGANSRLIFVEEVGSTNLVAP